MGLSTVFLATKERAFQIQLLWTRLTKLLILGTQLLRHLVLKDLVRATMLSKGISKVLIVLIILTSPKISYSRESILRTFFKTIALGILLALVFVYVSGGLLGDTSVDVSENSQGLLGSSLLRLKKTAAAMNDIKADFSKGNYQESWIWSWETLKEELGEQFNYQKITFVFIAKRTWKNTQKTFRKFKRHSKMNQITPKFRKAYKSTMRKIRSFFGDNNGSRYKGATFLPNDSEDASGWDSTYWSDFMKSTSGLKLEGILHAFNEVKRVVLSEGAGLLPGFKKCLDNLKYKMFGDMSNTWARYHNNFDSSGQDSSDDSSPKEEFKSWVKDKTTSASKGFKKLLFSIEKSAANFKKDAKPWVDKKAKSADKILAKMADSAEETASEVKDTVEKWYEKTYSSIKSKIDEFAT
ncbi:hypothetical protein DSO57_1025230 [Entomophthora muscae]|uniref:Uncharacterized protein n=1 Tax=Entomophthora muscae TaxID=34485 RepID=A0ACC2TPR4_9FUNG|nr:hypothetical protein DSO57_1025230 [Entomophthora muscae]